jgi:hypothetical protein
MTNKTIVLHPVSARTAEAIECVFKRHNMMIPNTVLADLYQTIGIHHTGSKSDMPHVSCGDGKSCHHEDICRRNNSCCKATSTISEPNGRKIEPEAKLVNVTVKFQPLDFTEELSSLKVIQTWADKAKQDNLSISAKNIAKQLKDEQDHYNSIINRDDILLNEVHMSDVKLQTIIYQASALAKLYHSVRATTQKEKTNILQSLMETNGQIYWEMKNTPVEAVRSILEKAHAANLKQIAEIISEYADLFQKVPVVRWNDIYADIYEVDAAGFSHFLVNGVKYHVMIEAPVKKKVEKLDDDILLGGIQSALKAIETLRQSGKTFTQEDIYREMDHEEFEDPKSFFCDPNEAAQKYRLDSSKLGGVYRKPGPVLMNLREFKNFLHNLSN